VEVVLPAATTLRHLSLEYLGRFDSATQSTIWALNPEIVDPNHIPAGQSVRLPEPSWHAPENRLAALPKLSLENHARFDHEP